MLFFASSRSLFQPNRLLSALAMPLDPALRRHIPLYLALTSLFFLPVVAPSSHANSLRTQARDLARALTRAVAIVFGATGVVVLGGGALLMGEKLYWRVREWMWGSGRGDADK
ncbi:hypothetical protein AAT19DRAFT_13071 [Rhodotorula toruloides]|uniref:Uncharacterized protein n=2 Tax=Rhodotorula toruloides TaxID=5286 RepID=A0A2T0ADG5_RHOTO|nr:hypothetical protein AAT19DRAFT_13071 [Rhodotorula toruloides]